MNHNLGSVILSGRHVPVDTRLWFDDETVAFRVRASNACFSVCTRGMYYTIVDWKEKIRGKENTVFGMGTETIENCYEMLHRLTMGETEVSHRNQIPLVVRCAKLPDKLFKDTSE